MNTKSTLVMAIIALVVAVVLFVVKPWEAPEQTEKKPTTARKLFEEGELDNVDRIELARETDTLVFAKSGKDEWKLTSPMEVSARKYEVDNLLREVKGLEYVTCYTSDSPVRPDDKLAGLDEPRVKVKLHEGDKLKAEFHVGRRLPTGAGSYLKLVSAKGKIYETKKDLSSTFAKPVKDYRDKTLVKFELKDAVKVTIETVQTIVLTKADDTWLIEEPMRGRADKSKAKGVVRRMSNLIVGDFKADEPKSLRRFGLDKPSLKVTVEILEEIPPKAKPGDPDTQPADTQPTKETKTYTLLVGGATKADGSAYFAKLVSAPWVFSIPKYTFEQMAVSLSDLREKSLASVSTTQATRIETRTPGGAMELSKKGAQWQFADGTEADSTAVGDLVKAVDDLKATDFAEPSVMIDWTSPRATITITQQGELNPVTVLVGNATASGKMTYVRNAAEEAVAVVREEDVEQLLAAPVAYRDRSVLTFPRERAKKLEITRADGSVVTLTREDTDWKMETPIQADADADTVRNVLQDMASLRAERVVAVGDKAKYGLDKPDVVLAVHLRPLTAEPNTKVVGDKKAETQPTATQPASTQPASTQPGDKEAMSVKQLEELLEYTLSLPTEDDGSGRPTQNPLAVEMLKKQIAERKGAASQPATAPAEKPKPKDVIHRLALAKVDSVVYARLDDQDTVYEVSDKLYEDATAEVHDRQIAAFEVSEVTTVSFGTGDAAIVLGKSGEDDWKYLADPVLPIDKEKVKEALNDLRDLKTHRYVDYVAADLAKYGLGKAVDAVEVSLAGKKIGIQISKTGPADDPDDSRYAVVAGTQKVFLLKGEQTDKLARKLEDFEKSGSQVAPQAPGRPMGGRMPR